MCVCVHGLMPGDQGQGLGATALVLHRSILARSLALLPPTSLSSPRPGEDGEERLDEAGEEGDDLAGRRTRFRFTEKEDWHECLSSCSVFFNKSCC